MRLTGRARFLWDGHLGGMNFIHGLTTNTTEVSHQESPDFLASYISKGKELEAATRGIASFLGPFKSTSLQYDFERAEANAKWSLIESFLRVCAKHLTPCRSHPIPFDKEFLERVKGVINREDMLDFEAGWRLVNQCCGNGEGARLVFSSLGASFHRKFGHDKPVYRANGDLLLSFSLRGYDFEREGKVREVILLLSAILEANGVDGPGVDFMSNKVDFRGTGSIEIKLGWTLRVFKEHAELRIPAAVAQHIVAFASLHMPKLDE